MSFIVEIFQNLMVFLVGTTGSLGSAILVFTLLIRSVLMPLTLPSLRSSMKMRDLQPEVKKLQKKHGKDKQALQKAQMELYKKYNINPLAGCLPQLAQIGVLIILYKVLMDFLSQPMIDGLIPINGILASPFYWWLDLSVPDQKYILPALAVITQLILSLMILPASEVRDVVPNKSKFKKVREENKKEENMADMAQSMQQQMMYIMPVMTGVIALQFPSGLVLYWVATTIFSIGQQWYVSGLGGIEIYSLRIYNFLKSKANLSSK
jgi:YidC/Oxa1 family membrane protein insertase